MRQWNRKMFKKKIEILFGVQICTTINIENYKNKTKTLQEKLKVVKLLIRKKIKTKICVVYYD